MAHCKGVSRLGQVAMCCNMMTRMSVQAVGRPDSMENLQGLPVTGSCAELAGHVLGRTARARAGLGAAEGADLDTDGAHSWAAASVGDAEGLVQVQVAHVRADVAGRCQADLHKGRGLSTDRAPYTALVRCCFSLLSPIVHRSGRALWEIHRDMPGTGPVQAVLHVAHLSVHVGAIHVALAAVLVDDLADLIHSLLVHAVRARVGDHQSCQPAAGASISVLLPTPHLLSSAA